MEHNFIPSQTDGNKCAQCRRSLLDHTEIAQCECCPNTGKCKVFPDGHNILMCASCFQKAEDNHQSAEKQAERLLESRQREAQARVNVAPLPMNSILRESAAIDSSIQLVTDIFNAKTIAIIELKKAIDSDETITNKPYALAETLMGRMTHLKDVIGDGKRQLIDWENEQRATQVYLNQMANTLRAEERAKLKIADINYQPTTAKVVKPKSTTPKKKIDIADLKVWAAKITQHTGIETQHNVLHMIMLSNNFANAEQAARHWARTLGKELPVSDEKAS